MFMILDCIIGSIVSRPLAHERVPAHLLLPPEGEYNLTCFQVLVLAFGIPELHHHHDLSNLLVRLHETVRFDNFLKRKRLGDDRLQTSLGEPFIDDFLPRSRRVDPR